MLIRRVLVFICPILIFTCLKLLADFQQVKYIVLASLLAVFLLLIFFRFFIKDKFFSQNYFYLLVAPFLLLLASIFFLLILGSDNLKIAIMIVCSLIIYFYAESVFLFYYQPAKYYPGSMENLSSLTLIITFFLLAINLNALNIFINLPLWLLSLILILFLSLLLMQNFWINKINHNLIPTYIFIINIVVLEIFWALSFLPANFLVSGIILTIIFYFVYGILKAQLIGGLGKKLVWRYIVISSLLLLLVIITNSWT